MTPKTITARSAYKAQSGFTRAMANRRDIPTPAIEGSRILQRVGFFSSTPQGVDVLAAKRPGEVADIAWLRDFIQKVSS